MISLRIFAILGAILLVLEIILNKTYIMDAVVGSIITWEFISVIKNQLTIEDLRKDIEYMKDNLNKIVKKIGGN